MSRAATRASGAEGVRPLFLDGRGHLLRRVCSISPPTDRTVASDRGRTTPTHALKASDRSRMKSLPFHPSRPVCPPTDRLVASDRRRTTPIHAQKASAHNRMEILPFPPSRLICPEAAPACPRAGASPRPPRQTRPDCPPNGLRNPPRPSRSVKVDRTGRRATGAPLTRSVAPGRTAPRNPSCIERSLGSHRTNPALPGTCPPRLRPSHLPAPALLPKPFLPTPQLPIRWPSAAPDRA